MIKVKKQILLITGLILLPLSIFAVYLSINLNKIESKQVMSYNEKSNIDYNVYLKKNNYFNEKYLPKGGEYIADIINNVNIDFNYTFNASKKFNYTYSYYIVGTLSTSQKGEKKKLWTKDYNLTKEITKKENNKNIISIKESAKIDYDKFNKIIDNFKKDYVLALDASLDVKLVVKIDGDIEEYNTPFKKQSIASVNIPLSESTISIEMDTKNINNKDLVNEIELTRVKSIPLLVSGILLYLFSVLLLGDYYIRKRKETSLYTRTLKKILNKYDEIIINVKDIPDLSDTKMLEVASFDELLDAQYEFRIPISYVEIIPGKKACFVLVHEGQAFIYILEK